MPDIFENPLLFSDVVSTCKILWRESSTARCSAEDKSFEILSKALISEDVGIRLFSLTLINMPILTANPRSITNTICEATLIAFNAFFNIVIPAFDS